MLDLISKDVQLYMEENNLHFTDFEKATIIYNSALSVNEKHDRLEKLASETVDEILNQQITDRLFDDRKIIETFMNDIEGYIYDLDITEAIDVEYECDCYADPQSAYEYGRSQGYLFDIGKYKIVSNETRENNKDVYFLEMQDPRNPDSVVYIERRPVSGLFYDADGALIKFQSDEIDFADKRVQNESDKSRFENAPINMPNPFEIGDIVRVLNSDMHGIVETSQDEWKSIYETMKDGGFASEVIEVLMFFGEGQVEHFRVNPLFLEKYEPNKDDVDYDFLSYGRDAYKRKMPYEWFTRFCETL